VKTSFRTLVAVTCLAVVLAAAAYLGSGWREPARAAVEADTPTLVVSGQGRVTATPDTASLTLGVITQGPTARAAQEENARVMGRVIAALEHEGVPREQMRTSRLSLSPVWHYPREGKPQLEGYRAQNALTLTTAELDRLGRYVDVAIAAGANSVQGLSFSVKDNQALVLQALELAVKDARAQAEVLAGAAGVTILGIKSIRTSSAEQPVRLLEMTGAMRADTPILPGETEVVVNVTVEFIIK